MGGPGTLLHSLFPIVQGHSRPCCLNPLLLRAIAQIALHRRADPDHCCHRMPKGWASATPRGVGRVTRDIPALGPWQGQSYSLGMGSPQELLPPPAKLRCGRGEGASCHVSEWSSSIPHNASEAAFATYGGKAEDWPLGFSLLRSFSRK